ncbi:MAG: transcription antitermination factor NusB [Parachlamydiaceae bacterium]|nr:transcription antitermination factor NusB [Parachlamydiaceae bacterium]
MALSPQKFREMVFQILYSKDVGNPTEDVMLELMMGELAVSKKNVRMANEKVQQVRDKMNEIDKQISSVSTSYDFDRIQTVTKNILRLGVFELFYDDAIPSKVAITEAMRIARKFGTPESATFVNAVLDNLYKSSIGQTVDLKSIENQNALLLQSEEQAKKAALEAIESNKNSTSPEDE